jgi:hypothetical protein
MGVNFFIGRQRASWQRPSRTGEISTGVPRLLIPGDFREEYDVSPDGHRFLLMKQDGAAPPIQLHVVTGWLDHVRQSVGATPSK